MPPEVAPTIEQLFVSFTEKVKQFDRRKRAIDRLGDPPDSETLREMVDLNQAIEKLAMDMERTNPNFASDYPDVEAENDRIYESLEKLRKAKATEGRPTTDVKEEAQEFDEAPNLESRDVQKELENEKLDEAPNLGSKCTTFGTQTHQLV